MLLRGQSYQQSAAEFRTNHNKKPIVIAIVIIRVATVGIQNSANSKPPFETEQTFDNRYNP